MSDSEEEEPTWRNENDWDKILGGFSHQINHSINKKLDEISKQIGTCVIRFQVWEQMFASSKQRVNDMNAVSPSFFCMVQHVFLENIALNFCNLLDPYSQGKFTNFTLEMLVYDLEKDGAGPGLVSVLKESLKEVCCSDSADRLRQLRNKHLAHFDETERLNVMQQGQMPYNVNNIKDVSSDIIKWIRFFEYAAERRYVEMTFGDSTKIQMQTLFNLLANNNIGVTTR